MDSLTMCSLHNNFDKKLLEISIPPNLLVKPSSKNDEQLLGKLVINWQPISH